MASNNIGKTFEQEFKECVPPDYYLYRLKDDTSGFYGVLIDITDDDVIVERIHEDAARRATSPYFLLTSAAS